MKTQWMESEMADLLLSTNLLVKRWFMRFLSSHIVGFIESHDTKWNESKKNE